MFAVRMSRPIGWTVQVGNVALVASNWLPTFWPALTADRWTWSALALAEALILVLAVEVMRYREPNAQTERLAGSASRLSTSACC